MNIEEKSREKEKAQNESGKHAKHDYAFVGPDGRDARGVVCNLNMDLHDAEIAKRRKEDK